MTGTAPGTERLPIADKTLRPDARRGLTWAKLREKLHKLRNQFECILRLQPYKNREMPISTPDHIPFMQLHANPFVLIDNISKGRDVIVTKDGRPASTLSSAQIMGYCHRLVSALSQSAWLDEAAKGVAQVVTGCASDARRSLVELRKRREDDRRALEQHFFNGKARLDG
jgi:antitoxin (DNA-binding transcriptional repressor) of toxin-antitoxin stability system